MPRYLIERSVPGGFRSSAKWHSYVSEDRREAFDIYDALSPEAIRRTATRNRLPVDVITEVRVLEPSSFERSR